MQLGMIGLGRMGDSMSRRLLKGGHEVVAYDTRADAVQTLVSIGATGATSLEELVSRLARPRTAWMMVPAGVPADATVSALAGLLESGDILIDGGNSNYKDSMRRARDLAARGIAFLDAGTSGGVWGLEQGYCLMVGGDRKAFDRVEPLLKTLAPSATQGYGHVGPSGAGHFAKMVHNGVEYGLMQAYAEGFELMAAKEEFRFDLGRMAELWRHGSVVRSWLLDLTAAALKDDPGLEKVQAFVDDSGEGRWTVEESVELAVPLPAITAALQARFRSRQDRPFGARLLAVMRNRFGGHAVRPDGKSAGE